MQTDITCNVQRKGSFTHRRTGSDQNQVRFLQSGSQCIEVLKTGADPREPAFRFIKHIDAFKGTQDDAFHRLKGAAILTAGHGQDLLLGFVHNGLDILDILISGSGNLRSRIDEVAQLSFLLNDFRIIRNVSRGRNRISELSDKGYATDLVQFLCLTQLLGQRNEIDSFIIVLQFRHRFIDDAVCLTVKVVWAQDLLHFDNRFFLYEHRSQNSLFSFNVLRRNAFW